MGRLREWRAQNARSILRMWRVVMPLFLISAIYGSFSATLSGGVVTVIVIYLWLVMMFQLARREARLPFRKRNLVFQP